MATEYSFYNNFPDSGGDYALSATPTREFSSLSNSFSGDPQSSLTDFANYSADTWGQPAVTNEAAEPASETPAPTRLRRSVVSFNLKHLDDRDSIQRNGTAYEQSIANAISTLSTGAQANGTQMWTNPQTSTYGMYANQNGYVAPPAEVQSSQPESTPSYQFSSFYGGYPFARQSSSMGFTNTGTSSSDNMNTMNTMNTSVYGSMYNPRSSFYNAPAQPTYTETRTSQWEALKRQTGDAPRTLNRRASSTPALSHRRSSTVRDTSNGTWQQTRVSGSQPLQRTNSGRSPSPSAYATHATPPTRPSQQNQFNRTYSYTDWQQATQQYQQQPQPVYQTTQQYYPQQQQAPQAKYYTPSAPTYTQQYGSSDIYGTAAYYPPVYANGGQYSKSFYNQRPQYTWDTDAVATASQPSAYLAYPAAGGTTSVSSSYVGANEQPQVDYAYEQGGEVDYDSQQSAAIAQRVLWRSRR